MRVIVSISSDIGTALAIDWVNSGHQVCGTYRTWSNNCERLKNLGVDLIECDLSDEKSIETAIHYFSNNYVWETLVLAAGDQKPIGLFSDVRYFEWSHSIQVNFLGLVSFLHAMMKCESKINKVRTVIFFAGGGTNSATERYSAYTISKIASIKLCELLDFEYHEYKFVCLGPGWVETKIHNSTIEAKENAGANFHKTLNMRENALMGPISKVVKCCNWIVASDKAIVGGRNFSVVNDAWGSPELDDLLIHDSNMYKLRRSGNELRIRGSKS